MAAPNFDFKGQVPMSSIIDSIAQKPMREQAMEIQAEQNRSQRISSFFEAVQTGLNIAKSATENSVLSLRKRGIEDMAALLARKDQPVAAPIQQFKKDEAGNVVPSQTVTPAVEQTQGFQGDLLSAASKANPDAASRAIVGQAFPTPLSGFGSRPIPMGLELPDGTQALGYFDPATRKYHLQTGEEAPAGTKRAYKYDIRPDAEGNARILSGSSGKQVGSVGLEGREVGAEDVGTVKSIFALPPEQRRSAQTAIDEFTKDPNFRSARGAFFQTERLGRALSARNFVFDEKLGLQLARMFGDAGNISIVEQEVGRENRQLVEKGKQLLERYVKTGELSEANRQEVLRALKIMQFAQLESIEGEAGLVTDRITGDLGELPRLNPEAFRAKLLGPQLQASIKKARKELEKLPDIEIDITSGAEPGERGTEPVVEDDVLKSVTEKFKGMSIEDLKRRRDELLRKRNTR